MASPVPSMNAIRVNNNEDLNLTSGTQLAITDGDRYIIVNLQYEEDGSNFNNSSEIVFHKPQLPQMYEKGSKIEYSDETIPITYECSAESTPDGQQICLDDEQARAVANLLEFHNQQTNPLNSGNSSANASTNGLGESINGLAISPSHDRHDQESNKKDLLSTRSNSQTLEGLKGVKKSPMKTYSRKKVLKSIDPSTLSSQTEIKPRFILPFPSVLSDYPQGRKRKRFVTDSVKIIPPSEFKQQLLDTSDIVLKKVDVAPPTKKEMYHLTYSGVGKYFAYPGRKIQSVPLSKIFFSRLTMTTEPKPSSIIEKIEPLDSDLRTPTTKDLSDISFTQSEISTLPPQRFTEAIAKKTASSFDLFCKGMTKPPKQEYARKRQIGATSLDSGSTPFTVKPKRSYSSTKSYSASKNKSDNLNTKETTSQDKNLQLLDTSQSELRETSVVYTIQADSTLVKSEMNSDQSNIFIDEENQESSGTTSNFEMLIAAAEQEQQNNFTPTGTESVEVCEGSVLGLKNENVVNTDVYSANDSIEQLIILGPNGEQYQVASSDFTLWHELDCNPH